METKEAITKLFIDIETFAGEKPPVESVKVPKNYTNPDTIRKYQEENLDKAWRDQATDPFKGEVFCVGMAVNDEDPFCIVGADEREVMEMLDIELHNHSYPKIIGYNLIEFDAYWLFVKGLQYRMKAVVNAFQGQRGLQLIDLMRVMDGPAWKKMASEDKMFKLLGFKGKTGFTGADVHDAVVAGQGDKVCKYCTDEIAQQQKSFKVLESFGLV